MDFESVEEPVETTAHRRWRSGFVSLVVTTSLIGLGLNVAIEAKRKAAEQLSAIDQLIPRVVVARYTPASTPPMIPHREQCVIALTLNESLDINLTYGPRAKQLCDAYTRGEYFIPKEGTADIRIDSTYRIIEPKSR